MSRLERRVATMERHTLRGTCPHRPPLVVYEDGKSRRRPAEAPCWCGRPRLRVTVRYLEDWANRYREPEEPDAGA